jgi:hypothetical protein
VVLAAWLMLRDLGLRHDLASAVALPMFWVKLALPALLLAGAWLTTLRLSRPGVRLGRALWLLAVPPLAIWALAACQLVSAAPEEVEGLVYGFSWEVCPLLIAGLSVPLFAALMAVMSSLAPTRPLAAGAATGLLAGSAAALVYALHCPEMGAPFLGIWYLVGMLIPTAAGALVGRWVLRW